MDTKYATVEKTQEAFNAIKKDVTYLNSIISKLDKKSAVNTNTSIEKRTLNEEISVLKENTEKKITQISNSISNLSSQIKNNAAEISTLAKSVAYSNTVDQNKSSINSIRKDFTKTNKSIDLDIIQLNKNIETTNSSLKGLFEEMKKLKKELSEIHRSQKDYKDHYNLYQKRMISLENNSQKIIETETKIDNISKSQKKDVENLLKNIKDIKQKNIEQTTKLEDDLLSKLKQQNVLLDDLASKNAILILNTNNLDKSAKANISKLTQKLNDAEKKHDLTLRQVEAETETILENIQNIKTQNEERSDSLDNKIKSGLIEQHKLIIELDAEKNNISKKVDKIMLSNVNTNKLIQNRFNDNDELDKTNETKIKQLTNTLKNATSEIDVKLNVLQADHKKLSAKMLAFDKKNPVQEIERFVLGTATEVENYCDKKISETHKEVLKQNKLIKAELDVQKNISEEMVKTIKELLLLVESNDKLYLKTSAVKKENSAANKVVSANLNKTSKLASDVNPASTNKKKNTYSKSAKDFLFNLFFEEINDKKSKTLKTKSKKNKSKVKMASAKVKFGPQNTSVSKSKKKVDKKKTKKSNLKVTSKSKSTMSNIRIKSTKANSRLKPTNSKIKKAHKLKYKKTNSKLKKNTPVIIKTSTTVNGVKTSDIETTALVSNLESTSKANINKK
jgi:hypothetical protein